ncbi:MAG: polysaccharide deacetylase family protein [Clostridiales bacterium]|nr:polysaccharide deacetylase family protein [Clostridiales bacterium]
MKKVMAVLLILAFCGKAAFFFSTNHFAGFQPKANIAAGSREKQAQTEADGIPEEIQSDTVSANEQIQIQMQDNTSGTAEAETDTAWEETKRVALTFDDGPHPVYTEKLLDGLAKCSVKATFFVIGENIPGNEALIERMDREGHLIGNHTYDHVKISDLSTEQACEQVEKTSALVKAITGKDTEYIRPPFGAWNKNLECPFTMIPVLWDVDPLDWTTANASDVIRRVLEDVESDDIILLHDCYESSVEAALQIVDALLVQGYKFVTVDELILE